MPTQTVRAGTSFVAQPRAPRTAPAPTVTPGPTNASEVYVANRGDGTVTVIDVSSRSAIFTLPIGGRPRGVEVIGTIGQQEIIVTN